MPKPKVFYTLDSDTLEKDFGIKSAKGLTFEEFCKREENKEGLTLKAVSTVLRKARLKALEEDE
tara:strand:+ start:1370 stop:1561 length:192 start_codon:yes stop_codon:yes gene_type:complete